MEKKFLNFVEPLPGTSDDNLNLFGIKLGSAISVLAGVPPQKIVEQTMAEALKKQADLIPNDPNPNAFAADLKEPAERLAKIAGQVAPSQGAIKAAITDKATRYKAAYDKAVADEAQKVSDAAAAAATTSPGAGATPGTPGAGAADPAAAAKAATKSKVMKYVLIGGGVILVGIIVYLIAKKKS
jgi:hypothetical protein